MRDFVRPCGPRVEVLEPRQLLSGTGSLDPTYGDGGTLLVPYEANADRSHWNAETAEVAADGAVYIAGRGGPYETRYTLSRFTPDGTFDTTFGADGIVDLSGLGFHSVADVRLHDGRVLVLGARPHAGTNPYSGFNHDVLLAQLNADGSLDTRFSGDGILEFYPTPDGTSPLEPYNRPKKIAFESGGKILIGLMLDPGGGRASDQDFAVLRASSDGYIDSGYGTDGLARLRMPLLQEMQDLVPLADGGVLAVGRRWDPSAANDDSPAMVKFDHSGQVVTSFGSNGFAVDAGRFGEFRAARQLPDGRIAAVVANDAVLFSAALEADVYLADGWQDPSFLPGATGAYLFSGLGPVETAFDAGGNLLVAGTRTTSEYTVSRLSLQEPTSLATLVWADNPGGATLTRLTGMGLVSDGEMQKIVLAGSTALFGETANNGVAGRRVLAAQRIFPDAPPPEMVTLQDGILRITGTDDAEFVGVRADSDSYTVEVKTWPDLVPVATYSGSGTITKVHAELLGGSDRLEFDGRVDLFAHLGDGSDQAMLVALGHGLEIEVRGGSGIDSIRSSIAAGDGRTGDTIVRVRNDAGDYTRDVAYLDGTSLTDVATFGQGFAEIAGASGNTRLEVAPWIVHRLATGDGDDVITTDSRGANAYAGVYAGNGNDTIHVLARSYVPFGVFGESGADTITLDLSQAEDPGPITVGGDLADTFEVFNGDGGGKINFYHDKQTGNTTLAGRAPVVFRGFGRMTLKGGDGADHVYVDGLPGTFSLLVDTAGGEDVLVSNGDALPGRYSSHEGRVVNWRAGAGNDALVFRQSTESKQPELHVTDSRLNVNDAHLSSVSMPYADVEDVELIGGSRPEWFVVNTSSRVSYRISGWGPTAPDPQLSPSGDILSVYGATPDAVLYHAGNGTGHVHGTDMRDIVFDGIEFLPDVDVRGTGSFEFEQSQALVINFGERVDSTNIRTDWTRQLLVTHLDTGQTYSSSYSAGQFHIEQIQGSGARFTYTGGLLPDGNYVATLPAGSVVDSWGNENGEPVTFSFFVLAGDANRDRKVDFADFLTLRGNFGRADGPLFSEADFNYDGRTDFADFLILRSSFGNSLAVPSSGSLFAGGEDDGDTGIAASLVDRTRNQ